MTEDKARELKSLADELGFSFNNGDLFSLAFVHSSYVNENPEAFPESNERLEFLGDALVGLVVAHELYQRYPDRPEGDLTALRSALVKGETLALIADSLQLGQYLLMGKGEEASGGRKRPSNLAATFEALVGAVFLDQGYDEARDFVLRVLSDALSSVGKRISLKNSKSLLQELVQGKGKAVPSYRVVEVTGEDHARTFTVEVVISGAVMGSGTGSRKSTAEREAASEALRAMREG